MAKIVKMEIERRNMDVNDTSERELVVRGLALGKYVVGRRNAWEFRYFREKGRPLISLDNYIAGRLHYKYNIEIDSADDVRKAQDMLQKEYGLSIINCFNRLLDGKSFFPDEEINKEAMGHNYGV
jgi:hypothetical protein